MVRGYVLLAGCLALAAPCAPRALAEGKSKDISGSWQAVSIVFNGTKTSPAQAKATRLTLDHGSYVVTMQDKVIDKGGYKVSGGGKLMAITITPEQGPGKGKALHGLCTLSGARFTECLGMPGMPAPKKLESGPASNSILVQYVRVKK